MYRGAIDQNLVGYYAFRLAGAVLPHIPERVAYPIATLMGDAYYRLVPGQWAGIAHNISHVLGETPQSPAVRRVVRQVCRNLAYNFYDLFRVPHLTKEQIADLVEVQGWEHVEAAQAAGRGLVLTAPHFGNLDIVMQIAAVRALPLTLPAEHLQPERLFRFICSLRASHGMLRLVPADGPLFEIFRALRRNEGVALAADRDLSGGGRTVTFFGAPARLPDSHVRLAQRTGAAMVAAFSSRRPGGHYAVHIFPVSVEASGDGDAAVDRGMEALVHLLEERIGADPAQWVLTVPLWAQRHCADRSEDEDCPDLTV
jgi:lauroyl/myristoyl acyltransferase